MQEETIEQYPRANERIQDKFPPPLKHFRRRLSSESTVTSVASLVSHKRKSFEERPIDGSAPKRRFTSIDEDDVEREGESDIRDQDQDERRDTSPPSQPSESNQIREGAENTRDRDSRDARDARDAGDAGDARDAPVEVIDITDSDTKSSLFSRRTSSDSDRLHREVKRVGSSELASAMALASLAFGKTEPKKSEPTTIHRPKTMRFKSTSSTSQAPMPSLGPYPTPPEFLLSRSMSTTSSGATSFGYPGMGGMNELRQLYNHHRINMNVPPEVFLSNSQLSRPPSFSQHQAPKKKQWVCDYCNEASFDIYEEACIHERSCSFNPNCIKVPHSRSSSALDLDEEEKKQAERLHRMKKYERHSFSDIGPIATRPDPEKKMREKKIYFEGSLPLAVPSTDSDWLSETNCYIRSVCVEAFSAKEADIMVSSKRGRISLYQVGIRCKFCAEEENAEKASGAVSFPVSVSGIYESVKRWKSVHLPECKYIPVHVQDKIKSLEKTACVPTTRQYWIDSAKAIGIDDTQDGLRFVSDPRKVDQIDPGTNLSRSRFAQNSSKEGEQIVEKPTSVVKKNKEEYIVFPEDKPTITPYVYCLMRQVQPCIFSEADRFLSRSKSKVGFAGFECRWCSGHAGLGRYFPSNPKALSTNSTSQNIYSHIQKCRKCPEEIKDELKTLKFEKPTWLRRTCGWRQAFFEKLWHRLHGEDGYDGLPYYE